MGILKTYWLWGTGRECYPVMILQTGSLFFRGMARGLAGRNDAGRPAPRREYYLLRRHTPSSSPATGGPGSSLHTDPAKMHQEMSGAKLRTSCA